MFKTLFVAVVPSIAACRNPEQHPVGVAYEGFATSGAASETDAGSQSVIGAVDAGSATEVAPIDASVGTSGSLDFRPPLPNPVAHVGFENIAPPTTDALAPDAGRRRPPRRR